MRVAVLSGGRSSEHDVSLSSGEAVRAGLAEGGHEVLDVRLSRQGRWLFEGKPLSLEPGGGLLDADAAFPVLHGPFGEDGTVQGLLELLDVPYVGAGVMASAVSMDKALFKDLMSAHGIPQVEYVAVREGMPVTLTPPAFVKPARLGSSVGISKAWSEADLDAALAGAFEHDPVALVERFSDGLEVECSVLGHRDPVASQPGEIVLTNADWYDYEAKYEPGGMELVVPARIPEAGARGRPPVGGRGVQDRELLGHGAGRLLRRGRARARQRAQHDPRLHLDQRLRQALRGQRSAVRGAARPAARALRSSATRRSAATAISDLAGRGLRRAGAPRSSPCPRPAELA